MPRVEVLRCDQCFATEDVSIWVIDNGRSAAEVLLCPDHEVDIIQLYGAGKPAVDRPKRLPRERTGTSAARLAALSREA